MNYHEIQSNLLKEINEACRCNGWGYLLTDETARCVLINKSLDKGPLVVNIAMTQGDAERFIDYVEKGNKPGRYVEYRLNNNTYRDKYPVYGDANTTNIQLDEGGYRNNYGVEVNIVYIEKWTGETRRKEIKKREKRGIYKLLDAKLVNPKFWYLNIPIVILDKIAELIGYERIYSKQNEKYKKMYGIDRFEDIQNQDKVVVNDVILKTKDIFPLKEIELDGEAVFVQKNIEDYLKAEAGENWRILPFNQRHKVARIIDADVPFKKSISILEKENLIVLSRGCQEELQINRMIKSKRERNIIDNMYEMAKQIMDNNSTEEETSD